MYSSVTSGTILGIQGVLIQVEADVSDGLPGFHMVGYLSGEIRESSERIRTAMRNSGFYFPPKRVVVNLSPADIRKAGSGFDVPIAVAMLISMGYLPQSKTEHMLFLGELGLNGAILPLDGVLSIADCAKKSGYQTIVVPYDNVEEAAFIQNLEVIGVTSLAELIEQLNSDGIRKGAVISTESGGMGQQELPEVDFKELKGQPVVRRAMEIAASGMHNLLMIGPPGAGKTLAAKCLTGILPDLTTEESMMLTKIYSVKGLLKKHSGLITKRPFRSPHHTITSASLIGGGVFPVPGEVTLAHHGVLFLDELPEFSRNAIEVLRQPLEDGHVLVSRLNASYDFPAEFMLVGSMNPCPCGCYPDRSRCNCSLQQIRRYQGKISRAVLDRMDIQLRLQPVAYRELVREGTEEDSATIRKRVCRMHELQRQRYHSQNYSYNSQLDQEGIRRYCPLTKEEEHFMQSIYEKHGLSGRGYHRLLKLARTIADIDGEEQIQMKHLAEAAAYRMSEPEPGFREEGGGYHG